MIHQVEIVDDASSGHITLAPMELWGDDALVLPIRQKDAKSMPKKSEM